MIFNVDRTLPHSIKFDRTFLKNLGWVAFHLTQQIDRPPPQPAPFTQIKI